LPLNICISVNLASTSWKELSRNNLVFAFEVYSLVVHVHTHISVYI
jgi:hypothetical protein